MGSNVLAFAKNIIEYLARGVEFAAGRNSAQTNAKYRLRLACQRIAENSINDDSIAGSVKLRAPDYALTLACHRVSPEE